jgi:hypothetical protein
MESSLVSVPSNGPRKESAPAISEEGYTHETRKYQVVLNATAPVDFAYHVLSKLRLHSLRVLDAWYNLFTTGDPAYFFAWQQAIDEEKASDSSL